MRIDPSIAALRGDPASQRRNQAALEAAGHEWASGPSASDALRELVRYGDEASLAECPALAGLLARIELAEPFANALVSSMARALGACPLGHVPFRHQCADGGAVLQIARAGRAVLSLVSYDTSDGEPAPHSVGFADGERHEICLAGHASYRRVQARGTDKAKVHLKMQKLELCRGGVVSLTGRGETKIVDRVTRKLVLLRLARSAQRPAPSLEYRLSDGALMHRAAGSCEESRTELILALLGSMGRGDAVPAMAKMARSGAGSLRWQALRQCLALDSETGFRALTGIAETAADPLHRAASDLRSALVARYPQLHAMEAR